MFCVVIGGDGAGKSSAIEGLKLRNDKWGYCSPSPSDLYPTEGLEFMDWTLAQHPREYVSSMKPLSRSTFFYLTSVFLYEYHVAPLLESKKVVICDSYYYRFLAKEMLLNPQGVKALFPVNTVLPKPDLIIMIDTSADTMLLRAKPVTKFETYNIESDDAFYDFQSAVLEHVRRMVEGIPIVSIDGDQTKEQVLDNLENSVLENLKT